MADGSGLAAAVLNSVPGTLLPFLDAGGAEEAVCLLQRAQAEAESSEEPGLRFLSLQLLQALVGAIEDQRESVSDSDTVAEHVGRQLPDRASGAVIVAGVVAAFLLLLDSLSPGVEQITALLTLRACITAQGPEVCSQVASAGAAPALARLAASAETDVRRNAEWSASSRPLLLWCGMQGQYHSIAGVKEASQQILVNKTICFCCSTQI